MRTQVATAPTFNIDKSDDVSLSSITIDPSIVFEKLASLKTGKVPGPDGWPAEVFKQCADQLCVPLSILFNKSLESSVLPDDWKIGYITPIYKKGNKTNAPINVLPHYPPLGHIWGYSGDLTQPNVKCPIVGQTYRVKSPPLAPVVTRD